MNDVALFLLCIAGIFLLGALGEVVFQRTHIPDVIWLILAGILLGPITGMVTRELLNRIAPFFAAITLVVVLFEGGSALRLGELSRAAPRSALLAVSGFAMSVIAMMAVSMLARVVGLLPSTWTLMHGMMLGTILGGSSSIIIMPAMGQARMPAKVANLVSLESALTDALCVVGTTALIDVMLKRGGNDSSPLLTLGRSFGIGLAVGGAAGLLWLLFLRFLRSNEHAYPVTLSALMILYVVVDHLGGSAAFGILTCAIVLGNAPTLTAKFGFASPVELDSSVRGFHRQMTFIVKSFFFVFIGAMLGPPWAFIALGVVLGGTLYAARMPAVSLSLLGGNFSKGERGVIGVALPRGMAAGVLATLPGAAGVPGTEQLPVAVFAAVFTTILVFAVGFPAARRKVPETPREALEQTLLVPAAQAAASGLAVPSAAAAAPAPATTSATDPSGPPKPPLG